MGTRKIRAVTNGSNLKGRATLSTRLLKAVPLLALLFIFISCNDLQTVNKEAATKPAVEAQKGSGGFISGGKLLPEPDLDALSNGALTAKNKAAGKGAKRFKRVMVHPKGEKPGSNGAPVVATFADAADRVEVGGVIKVFAGEYELTEQVVIDRPVTIEPMKGSVVIRHSSPYAFVALNVQDGPVVFNDLAFENTGGSLSVVADGSEVQISGSSFDVMNGTAGAYGTAGATLTIENSTFINGTAGSYSSGEETVLNISSSTFSGQGLVAVQHQNGASGRVKGNSISDCGTSGCATMFAAGKVDLLENTFSDDTPSSEVDGFFHHVVLYSESTGLVSGNLFDGCGHGQCIAGIDKSNLEVSGNEFRVYKDQETRFVIVASDGTGGEDPYGREVDMLVTNNIVIGSGGNYENEPWNPEAYSIIYGGLLIENLGRMEAYGNTIDNVNVGIMVQDGGNLAGARDNKINNVHTAVSGYSWKGLGDSFASVRGNDFTNYHLSVVNDAFTAESDLSCNWWGTAAGPQNPEGVRSTPSLYTPWASSPVAGTGSCSE